MLINKETSLPVTKIGSAVFVFCLTHFQFINEIVTTNFIKDDRHEILDGLYQSQRPLFKKDKQINL